MHQVIQRSRVQFLMYTLFNFNVHVNSRRNPSGLRADSDTDLPYRNFGVRGIRWICSESERSLLGFLRQFRAHFQPTQAFKIPLGIRPDEWNPLGLCWQNVGECKELIHSYFGGHKVSVATLALSKLFKWLHLLPIPLLLFQLSKERRWLLVRRPKRARIKR